MPKKAKIFEDLERLCHLVPTAFYWVDADSTIIGGNKLALEMIKEVSTSCTSSCEDVIGRNAFDMFPPEAARELISNNKKTIKEQKPLFFEETIVDLKTNKKKFRNVIRSPLYEDGKIVGILILVSDITQAKEKAVLELEKQLQFKNLVDQTAYEFKSPLSILLLLIHQCSGRPKDTVFDILNRLTELTPTLLYWFDEKNTLLISNKWDSEAVGGNFVGKNPYDYFPFEIADNLVKNNKAVMKTGKILSYDEQLKNAATGEINYYRAFKAPLYDNEGKSIGVMGTSVNVTAEKDVERLKLENELQNVKLKEQEKYEMMITQLAHDIRSPTASLSMIIDTCKKIPERERITLMHAANRITDIANNLLNSYKRSSLDLGLGESDQPVLVSLALSRIVSEKRKQYANSSITIKVHNEPDSELLFSRANLLNFERMISNLISNSFESMQDRKGKIELFLSKDGDHVKIIIKDEGVGMSQSIVDKIMHDIVVTTGKRSGYGIGFTQVRETLKNSNGKMSIESIIAQGTQITLLFPIIDTPDWIAKQISLPENAMVVVLDDDPSIHGAWELCFKNCGSIIQLKHFRSGEKALDFISSFSDKSNIFLLADFELIDQEMNGLQVIERAGIPQQSFLVTSHYNKKDVVANTTKFGIKILPKQLAYSIPIVVGEGSQVNQHRNVDIVLIEDDEVFADSLAIFLESKSFTVDIYSSADDFLENLSKYPKVTRIYTDNSLKRDKITGVELANKLYECGYQQLFLLTGEDFAQDQLPDFLKVIVKGDMSALNRSIE